MSPKNDLPFTCHSRSDKNLTELPGHVHRGRGVPGAGGVQLLGLHVEDRHLGPRHDDLRDDRGPGLRHLRGGGLLPHAPPPRHEARVVPAYVYSNRKLEQIFF